MRWTAGAIASASGTAVARDRAADVGIPNASTVLVNDQLLWTDLDEAHLVKRLDDRRQVRPEQREERGVRRVAGGHQEQAPRGPADEVARSEVTVLGDHDPVVSVGKQTQLAVGAPVAVAAGRCAPRRGRRPPAPERAERGAARRRGTSRSRERHDSPHPGSHGAELEGGQDVVTLEVLVVSQDLVDSHPAGKQLEDVLDGVAQPTDGRLAVAHRRVRGDPIEPRHAVSVRATTSERCLRSVVAMIAPYEIRSAEDLGGHRLRLAFADGLLADVDLSERFRGALGPVLEPLRDEAFFAQVTVDAELGTVVWPNGADLAPDALYDRAVALPGRVPGAR